MMMRHFTTPDGKNTVNKGGIIMDGNPFADIVQLSQTKFLQDMGLQYTQMF